MKINHVHHIAVNAKDIEASVKFYTNIMGFEEQKRADIGLCILVYMKLSDDCFIELFDLKGNIESCTKSENCMGLRHIAFDVEDLAGWQTWLKQNSVVFLQEMTELGEIGKKVLLIQAPDGVVIELCEPIG